MAGHGKKFLGNRLDAAMAARYIVFHRHVHGSEFTTVSELAKIMRCSKMQAWRALDTLERAGEVVVSQRNIGKGVPQNLYTPDPVQYEAYKSNAYVSKKDLEAFMRVLALANANELAKYDRKEE